MRILVTGGAGFIGSHLCEALIEANHQVICLDNLYTGSEGNISHLLGHANFEFLKADINDALALTDLDQIYNLACPASPINYQLDPVGTVRTNVIGSSNLLELAVANNAQILQASTSEVYGDPEVHPQPESYWGRVNPIGPRACYDEGKRAAETLFFDYQRQYGARIKVARIFNTYGPRMQPNDGRVVSNFLVQAIEGRPITIYGTGKQTRSFCFVDDLVRGLILLMNTHDGVLGPVNLGNPNEFSMAELAEKVTRVVGGQSTFEFLKLPIDDPRQRQPDISLAKDLLGWEPVIQLEQGLETTAAYFKALLSPGK